MRDPIVEEIHAIRRELDKKEGPNLARICQAVRRREARSKRKFVTLPIVRRETAA